MWKAGTARRAKGEDVSGGNLSGLQDQVPGQDMTRQIAIEVQDPRTIGDNPPENC